MSREPEMPVTVPSMYSTQSKTEIIEQFRSHLEGQGFTITECDAARPWGAFLRIVNAQADKFIATYFGGIDLPASAQHGERSPKILLVAPDKRLSWQHHDRRSEIWRVVSGMVGVFTSTTNDHPQELMVLAPGDAIEIPQGTRHRLVGLDEWGAVAEIWIHTVSQHPSDEDDIHRHQDDFERN